MEQSQKVTKGSVIQEIQCRSLITRTGIPAADFCINPYVGCLHGCRYCYAEFMKFYSGHSEPWGHFLDVKVNAAQVLSRQLSRGSYQGEVLLGTVTDCYQPAEKKYRLMPEILKILGRFRVPASILTKSDLVTRDVERLLDAGVEVGFSIGSDREDVRSVLEPGAPSIQRRLTAQKELHTAGVRTHVFVSPILPGLMSPRALVEKLDPRSGYVMAEMLNPRARRKPELISALKRNFPAALDLLQAKLRSPVYWDEVEEDLAESCRAAGLEFRGLVRHL